MTDQPTPREIPEYSIGDDKMLIALGKFIVDLLFCMYGDVDIGCSDSGSATLSLVHRACMKVDGRYSYDGV